MDTTQIIETIKSLNLNINSQTAVEITKLVMPYFWADLIMSFLVNALFVIGVIFIAKVLIDKYYDQTN